MNTCNKYLYIKYIFDNIFGIRVCLHGYRQIIRRKFPVILFIKHFKNVFFPSSFGSKKFKTCPKLFFKLYFRKSSAFFPTCSSLPRLHGYGWSYCGQIQSWFLLRILNAYTYDIWFIFWLSVQYFPRYPESCVFHRNKLQTFKLNTAKFPPPHLYFKKTSFTCN